jgi:DNA-binding transcriptional LysR family regulator
VSLFDREKKLVRLTPAGKVYLQEAHRILSAVQRASELARNTSMGTVGSLRVHFVPTAAYDFLPGVISTFKARFPQVELDLAEEVTPDIVEALREDRADLGLVRNIPADDSAFEFLTAGTERLIVALPQNHPLARRKRVALKLLAKEDFVASHGMRVPGFRSQIEEACREAGFAPRVRHEAVTIPTIVSLVSGGLGVALVPAAARAFPHRGVVYLDLTGTGKSSAIRLIAMWKRSSRSIFIENFLACIKSRGAR